MDPRFILTAVFLINILAGCSTLDEMQKGFTGTSVKVLETKRPSALKKSFALGYDECYFKVKEILSEDLPGLLDMRPVIYAEDHGKKLIAVYPTSTDTTPVGIFFTEEGQGVTLVEISSPSTYAKEELANRIFAKLSAFIKSAAQEEKIDVKEEPLGK